MTLALGLSIKWRSCRVGKVSRFFVPVTVCKAEWLTELRDGYYYLILFHSSTRTCIATTMQNFFGPITWPSYGKAKISVKSNFYHRKDPIWPRWRSRRENLS